MGPIEFIGTESSGEVEVLDRSQQGPPGAPASSFAELLRGIMSYARVLNIYPPGHARIGEHATRLEAAVAERVDGRLVLSVDREGVKANGDLVAAPADLLNTFADLLRFRGIAAFVLSEGVEAEDLRTVTDLLRTCHKTLLRDGGARVFLDRNPLRRVEVLLLSGLRIGPVGTGRGESETPHAPLIVRSEEGATGEGESVEECDPSAEEDSPLQAVTVGVEACLEQLKQPESGEQRSPEELPRHTDEAELSDPLESIEERPGEDLKRKMSREDIAYGLCGDEIFPGPAREMVPGALAIYRERQETHEPARQSAAILCNLLPEALNKNEYFDRRALLLRSVESEALSRDHLRHALCGMAAHVDALDHEEIGGLLLEVAAVFREESVVQSLVTARKLTREVARETALMIALQTNALDLLAFLARAPVGVGPRQSIVPYFLRIVRGKPTRFQEWARTNRDEFLHPDTFALLLENCHYLLGPVVKEILTGGADAERQALVRTLCTHKTERSLRLLTLGMRYVGERRDCGLIEAFGAFNHPLAVSVLREVIHRCNTEHFCPAEAEAAMRALRASPSEQADAFLWEVCTRRFVGFHSYGRRLRALAERALEK